MERTTPPRLGSVLVAQSGNAHRLPGRAAHGMQQPGCLCIASCTGVTAVVLGTLYSCGVHCTVYSSSPSSTTATSLVRGWN